MSVTALQEFTFTSKYARYNPEKKRRDTFKEAISRVAEMHKSQFPQLAEEIDWAFARSKEKRVLGSQRALQYAGEPLLRINARGYNCTVSYVDRIRFFQEALWLLLCGCGTGFSVQKHHIAKLPDFHLELTQEGHTRRRKTYTIADSIEGWADALGVLLATYMPHEEFSPTWGPHTLVKFDYSLIRPQGAPLSSGAGKAPGPKPLEVALESIRTLLDRCLSDGQTRLRSIDAYDIVMHASDAVLSGGIRRAASIALFSPDDELMITAKTGNWFVDNPQRGRSNNSALLIRDSTTRDQFHGFMKSVKEFGEPGFVWADSTEGLFNPCCEIGLFPQDIDTGESGWSMCVAGDTNLLTRNGLEVIEQVVGKEVEIWNGEAWKTVTPFQTGVGQKLYRVSLGDGSYLDCTANHKWLVKDRFMKDYNEVTTDQLTTYSKYRLHTPPPKVEFTEGVHEEYAYEYGFVMGDGCAKRPDTLSGIKTPRAYLFKDDKKLQLRGVKYEGKKNLNGTDYTPITFNTLDAPFSNRMKYEKGIPKEIFTWDRKSLCDFIAGWMDADGTKCARGFRIYGSEDKIRGLQLLLTKLGVYSSVNLMALSGTFTNICERKQSIWYIQVSEVTGGLYSRRMKLSNEKRKLAGKGMYQVIRSVVELEGTHDTFCLTEEDKHLCLFNNVLTHQCNLTEINGKKCKTEEDFRIAAKAAAIIGTLQAAYTRFEYLGEVSESIVRREALLGVSITGIQDSPEILLNPDIQRRTAQLVVETNKEIAAKIGINQAARTTCTKPAGTTSLILGTSSGIHAHHSKKYIRRIQANILDAPAQFYSEKNPLSSELSVWSRNGTDISIAFCVETGEGARTRKEVDALTLLSNVKLTQNNWVAAGKVPELCVQPYLNHNVSNTISVKDDEWEAVEEFIYENRHSFAGISLLPASGDLDYPQAPFTAIHDETELVKMYGKGAMFASGVIVDGQHAFDGNLWNACDTLLNADHSTITDQKKVDWIRRAKQFAERYFRGDVRKMTYSLKEIANFKLWCDLRRETVEVDFSELTEEQDDTKIQETIACAGGSCSLE